MTTHATPRHATLFLVRQWRVFQCRSYTDLSWPFLFQRLTEFGGSVSFIAVAVFSTVLLAFQQTRVYGAVGWALLFLAYPYWTVGTVLVTGSGYYLYQWRQK